MSVPKQAIASGVIEEEVCERVQTENSMGEKFSLDRYHIMFDRSQPPAVIFALSRWVMSSTNLSQRFEMLRFDRARGKHHQPLKQDVDLSRPFRKYAAVPHPPASPKARPAPRKPESKATRTSRESRPRAKFHKRDTLIPTKPEEFPRTGLACGPLLESSVAVEADGAHDSEGSPEMRKAEKVETDPEVEKERQDVENAAAPQQWSHQPK